LKAGWSAGIHTSYGLSVPDGNPESNSTVDVNITEEIERGDG
jgi:hypothetical protein